MRNFIEKQKILSLIASNVITDEHIADYLQGLAYEAWKDGKDLTETEEVIMGKDEAGNDIIETKLVHVYEEVEVDVEAWKKENYAILRKDFYPNMAEYLDPINTKTPDQMTDEVIDVVNALLKLKLAESAKTAK